MNPFLLLCIPVLLVLFTGLIGGPLVVLALNRRALRVTFDSPEEQREFLARSVHLQEWVDRLKELGFTMIGIATEKIPLWGPGFKGLSMVSISAEAYAGIVLHPDGEPASMYFYTPMRGGGMVFTRNFGGDQAEAERYSVRNVESINFKAILDDHLERIEKFRGRGLQPAVGSSQSARITATADYYDSEYGRKSLRSVWQKPVLNFMAALALLLVVIIFLVVTK
jgi:hypothetical protein